MAAARYDNAANRAYYAVFRAAIAALMRDGGLPERNHWDHAFVQAEFASRLIRRRKMYPPELAAALIDTMRTRHKADYDPDPVTEREARRVLRTAQAMIEAIDRPESP